MKLGKSLLTLAGAVLLSASLFRAQAVTTNSFTYSQIASNSPSWIIAQPTTPVIQGNTLFSPCFFGGTNAFTGCIISYDIVTGMTNLVFSFNGTNGFSLRSGLSVCGTNMYGSTFNSVSNGLAYGPTLYRLTPSGQFSLLYRFVNTNNGTESCAPPVTQDGVSLYGSMSSGGTNNLGTFYCVSNGALLWATSLKNSTGTDPFAPLCFGPSGDPFLYGTTSTGANGFGTIVKINPTNGALTVLHSFTNTTDSGGMESALVTRPNDPGHLYGAAQTTNVYNHGIIFQMNTDGTGFTALRSFSTTGHAYYWATPCVAPDGSLIVAGNDVTMGYGGFVGRFDTNSDHIQVANLPNGTNFFDQTANGFVLNTNDNCLYTIERQFPHAWDRVQIPWPNKITYVAGSSAGTVVSFAGTVKGYQYTLRGGTNLAGMPTVVTVTASNSVTTVLDTNKYGNATYQAYQWTTTNYQSMLAAARLVPEPPLVQPHTDYSSYPTVVFPICTNCPVETNGPFPFARSGVSPK